MSSPFGFAISLLEHGTAVYAWRACRVVTCRDVTQQVEFGLKHSIKDSYMSYVSR